MNSLILEILFPIFDKNNSSIYTLDVMVKRMRSGVQWLNFKSQFQNILTV